MEVIQNKKRVTYDKRNSIWQVLPMTRGKAFGSLNTLPVVLA